MKNNILQKMMMLCIALLWTSSALMAQNAPFITKWNTNNPSTDIYIDGSTVSSTNTQIYFPGIGKNYTIEWVEVGNATHSGTITNVTTTMTNPKLIEFNTPGEYLVKVYPTGFSHIRFARSFSSFNGDQEKLTEIQQWGDVQWKSMQMAFYGCKNMQLSATAGNPDLSDVTYMGEMFRGCTAFNGNINGWDVSNITDMESMFVACTAFDGNISGWDVSNVTNMSQMFSGCPSFNQPLNGWDVSKVTDMESMFKGCTSFNQLLNSWDVSKVTDMESMFSGCPSFNQPLDNWTVSNVTSMRGMFKGCTSFNKSLNSWDVSSVTDMLSMFEDCTSFNQPLNNWNVSNVTSMFLMFKGCTSFNQPLKDWTVSNVTVISSMFKGCASFNQPLNDWTVSSVTSMRAMFEGCTSFNQPLNSWDVSKVTNMWSMFYGCTSFNQPLHDWDISQVTDMNYMLGYCGMDCNNYSITLTGWADHPNTPDNLTLGAQGLTYNAIAQAPHDQLINDKGWTINGDSYDADCGVALWEGDVDSDWSNADNWVDNVVPDASRSAYIPSILMDGLFPELTSAATCNNLYIQEPASVLGVNHLTVTGEAIIEKSIVPYTNNTDGWNLISAPVHGMDITGSAFQPVENEDDFYVYDNPSNMWLNYYDGMNETGEFMPGKGYLVAYHSNNAGLKTFIGTLNNAASYTIPFSTDKWHLMGNPYASSIDWSQVTLDHVSSIKRLNNLTGAYEDLPYDEVTLGEGVFVYAEQASASVEIPVIAQTPSTFAFSKSATSKAQFKALFGEGQTVSVALGIHANATQNFDWQYDARYLPPVTYIPNLAAITKDNVQVSTYMLNDEDNAVVIPLHFKVYDEEEITFSFEAKLFENKVMLEDKQTGEMIDITAEGYTFTASPSDNTDRFVLHIQKNAIDNEEDLTLQDVDIYAHRQQVYVQVEEAITKGKVTLFNVLGQAVVSQSINQGSNVLQVPHTGAYVVTVTSNEGVVSKKVVIRE